MEPTMIENASFEERRKLFKDIWDTAVNQDDKEAVDGVSKPKVIKTLRLAEVDRSTMVGKKKKHRLKNLRTVCNKLLDFCDQQDSDDLYYQQMAEADKNRNRGKCAKRKRKASKSKSMYARAQIMATAFEKIYDLNRKISRNLSPIHFSQLSITQTASPIRNNYGKEGTKQGSGVVKKRKRRSDYIFPGKLNYNVIRKVQSKKLLPMPKINIY